MRFISPERCTAEAKENLDYAVKMHFCIFIGSCILYVVICPTVACLFRACHYTIIDFNEVDIRIYLPEKNDNSLRLLGRDEYHF